MGFGFQKASRLCSFFFSWLRRERGEGEDREEREGGGDKQKLFQNVPLQADIKIVDTINEAAVTPFII